MHRFKTHSFFLHAFLISAGFILYCASPVLPLDSNKVNLIQLNDDTINPVTAEYIIESIDRSADDGVQCLIIKLDTPGGLLNSTRMIVKRILDSEVPIVVYIAPDGSRAGSAGVFITYASHVAAMAPSTNIGAAHPVQMGMKAPQKQSDWDELKDMIRGLYDEKAGRNAEMSKDDQEKEVPSDGPLEHDEDPMSSKILEDTVAFVKAIAHARNRNEQWAVDSVVKSKSITSDEALEKGVVEIIAKSDQDLLDQIDGRTVKIGDREVVLKTKDAYINHIEMQPQQKFFNVLANPNIAYFLMILGFYGLLFEVTHPGFGVPGVLGIIFLILAFYSMQTLPTNYAGLALMILGIILLITEVYTPTFGILTLGGLTCLVLGSMLLFDSADPVMRVSRTAIFSFSITTGAITLFLLYSVLHSQRAKVKGGQEGLIGEKGEVQKPITPDAPGKVFVHGELWNAIAEGSIKKGEAVTVKKVDGMTLTVEKLNQGG